MVPPDSVRIGRTYDVDVASATNNLPNVTSSMGHRVSEIPDSRPKVFFRPR